MIEGGDVDESSRLRRQKGMPASNPRVKSSSPRTRGEFVTICVAGCDGKPSIVQMLPMPIESAHRRDAHDGWKHGRAAQGRRMPAGFTAADSNTITCVAGCGGAPGQVLQRMPGSAAAGQPVPRGDADAGNEPLDIGR